MRVYVSIPTTATSAAPPTSSTGSSHGAAESGSAFGTNPSEDDTDTLGALIDSDSEAWGSSETVTVEGGRWSKTCEMISGMGTEASVKSKGSDRRGVKNGSEANTASISSTNGSSHTHQELHSMWRLEIWFYRKCSNLFQLAANHAQACCSEAPPPHLTPPSDGALPPGGSCQRWRSGCHCGPLELGPSHWSLDFQALAPCR